MARLVTRSELARVAGVSPAAITKACKGGLLAACVGKRVDLDHPSVVEYLEKKGVTPTLAPNAGAKSSPTRPRRRPAKVESGGPSREPPKARPRRAASSPPTVDAEAADAAEPIESFVDMTLRELTDRFGTETAFKDWLDARKKIADTREKELRNEETDGRLIERELVKTHVFGAIEAGNRRLLGDSPKTIARRLYALAKAGAAVEEAEKVVREIISSQLRPVAEDAARVLRNA